ncbi:hypothetical protein ACGFYQ_30095 [Streptomyces sp. NPDC048258]|uniref:hypothetical protein n=1 Tax=Streptomyces sp. NPDC048258 TaxID=3365527 RepID=UPI00371A5714
MTSRRETHNVSDAVFRAVYDSPASLPGRHRWVTREEDVRKVEELLGMEAGTIGAPLWLSGDTRECSACGREPSWLDIVSSALGGVHERKMIAEVILGERKYVNAEAPEAIAGLRCHGCSTPIEDMRSFKCHNWAYAFGDLQRVLDSIA